MSQEVDSELKQIVLAGGPFGPQEIKQMVNAIAEDFSQYRALRDAVAELEVREDRSPAASVRLGVCYYLLGRYSAAIADAQGGRRRCAGALLPGQDLLRPGAVRPGDRQLRRGGQGRLQRRRLRARPGRSAAHAGRRHGAPCIARLALRRRRADGRIPLSARRHGLGPGRQPGEVVALFERAVEADPNHAGALFGLAMENDRRGNDEIAARSLRTLRRAVSHATSARC